ncbi:MAG TPA: MFS transporter [Streptosporangiaceae bacterium]|nr:MFS transporter [Streptosporangiaceae bacterium]HLN70702.1 MFS transporter [Streptosporangiaceae bacterium]
MKGGPPRATFRDVLAVREFRVLWVSVILSTAGDRLALVALTLLVYGRTHSPLLAAVVYAAGYLPWVIGGLFLADVADRRPRRSVMVFCDAARAVLVAAMLIPHVPVAGLVALLFVATMFAPPFDSAKASITPDILHGERYVLGTAILQTTLLAAQVAGAVAGGVGVALIGVQRSLAIDAATFVLSGVLIALGTRARPPAARPETVQPSPLARTRAGFRLVFGDPVLRTLLLLAWLVVFYTIPEGIAAPYAARLGGGPIAAGLVIASTTLSTTVAIPLFTRFVRPRQRTSLMGPLAVLTCGSLVLTALAPGLAASLVIFSLSAAFGVYQIAANTAFVVRVPNERRAQAFGIASVGVIVGQGAAFVAAGAAAEVFSPATVIAVGGGIGTVVALILTFRWRHVSPPGGRHAAGRRPGHTAARSFLPLRGSG